MPRKKSSVKSSGLAPELFWQLAGGKGKKTPRAEHLATWCQLAQQANSAYSARAYRYACAFDGVTLTSITGAEINYADAVYDNAQVPIIKNTVRRLVNTFVAKSWANDNPCPQMVSTDGSFEQRMSAEIIDDVLMTEYEQPQGQFSSLHEMNRHGAVLATCATGKFWIFAFPSDYGVEAELDDGLTVQTVRTGQYGKILTLCRTVWRDPEWLISRYPEHATEILAQVEVIMMGTRYGDTRLAPNRISRVGTRAVQRRLVRVHQGWRSMIGEEEGCEVFCLKNGYALEDNVWEYPGPPGVDWVYERELDGEQGVPLTQSIYRMFMRSNEMIFAMDRAEYNTPQHMFLCRAGSGDSEQIKAQLQGAVGVQIIEVTGDPSQAVHAVDNTGLSRQSVQMTEMYDQAMYDITGIGKNQAYGTRQPGTTSGLHESLTASYYTELFADQERRLIQFRAVDQARIFIWALQRVEKYERWVGDPRKKRLIKSSDLDLDDSKYTLAIKPASEEKDSPKARLEKAEKLLSDPAGRFTGADLVETWKTFDDTRASQKAYAIDEWVEEQCSRWLRGTPEQYGEEGWYQSPSKWMMQPGLESALSITSTEFLRARQEGAPRQRLALFERFMDETTELIDQIKKHDAEIQALAAGKGPMAGSPPASGPAPGPAPAPGGAMNAGPGGPPGAAGPGPGPQG